MNRRILPWLAAILVAGAAPFSLMVAGSNPTREDDDVLDVAKAAANIDRLVLKQLGQYGVAPEPRVDDSTDVRRLYLEIIGRIPTAKETTDYLEARSRNKRSELIDRLLASEGRTSHAFNYWADLLRVKTRLPGGVSGEPYVHWVKNAIATNMPYDDFVAELLTATGPAYLKGNGATGYFLRDRGMLADNMANTIRIFLGTRLECAQCHNHPFDKWKQTDFYKMAAFTGGLQFNHRLSMTAEGSRLQEMGKRIEEKNGRDARRAFDRMVQPMTVGLYGDGDGRARLPGDYQYKDAKPGARVGAEPIFPQSEPMVLEKKGAKQKPGTRKIYADWLTSPENPRFTVVIANRIWKKIMGAGLIEPVDIITDQTKPSNPELMAYLEELMREADYDLRQFEKVLLNTATYRRRASMDVRTDDHKPLFTGPRLHRMTAEQIWDSMLTLVVDRVDEAAIGGSTDRAEDVYKQYEALTYMEEKDIQDQVGMSMMRQMDRKAYDQMMARMEAKQRKKDRIKSRENRGILRELRKARKRNDLKVEAILIERLERRGVRVPPRPGNGKEADLMRASDLSSPAVAGHALRQFGQSDRDQIEAATTDATIPQVLMLLNGFIEDSIIGREDEGIMKQLAKKRTASEKIKHAYLSILNREPSDDEWEMWRRDAKQHRTTVWKDLVWSLLNSHEFMFVQ